MGRKSVLTPDQWAEVERRHLIDGQSINSLAKEFKVDESTVRKKINPNKPEDGKSPKPLLVLALNKIAADKTSSDISEEVADMPMVRQKTFNSLCAKLSNISTHMASGSEYSAATFHRFSALANEQAQKIDDADPLKNTEALRGVAALQSLANEAAKMPLSLLAANKDQLTPAQQSVPSGLDHFYAGSK